MGWGWGGMGRMKWGGKSWSAQAALQSTTDTYFSRGGRQTSKVRVPADPVPGEGPLLVHRWPLLMTERAWSPLGRTLSLLWVSHPHDLIETEVPPRAPLQIASCWGLYVTMWIWGVWTRGGTLDGVGCELGLREQPGRRQEEKRVPGVLREPGGR